MLKNILKNWDFMRFFRLALGIAIIVQAAYAGDWTMGIVGALFTAMPVFNVGCCGTAGCRPADTRINSDKAQKEITYEEVV